MAISKLGKIFIFYKFKQKVPISIKPNIYIFLNNAIYRLQKIPSFNFHHQQKHFHKNLFNWEVSPVKLYKSSSFYYWVFSITLLLTSIHPFQHINFRSFRFIIFTGCLVLTDGHPLSQFTHYGYSCHRQSKKFNKCTHVLEQLMLPLNIGQYRLFQLFTQLSFQPNRTVPSCFNIRNGF